MPKKDYFLIADTETTMDDLVADFGAVVCDRKGNIVAKCAAMVHEVFTDRKNHPLFHAEGMGELWTKRRLTMRYNDYTNMIDNGTRILASVQAINNWLENVRVAYNPVFTAYNAAFDLSKCRNTGINTDMFEESFCLWYGAVEKWAKSKKYRTFIMDNHYFNAPTKLRNMSYKTNAEVMARFVTGNENLEDEPHTALEDIIGYELPILVKYVKGRKRKSMDNVPSFNWRGVQVKDHFCAK